MKIVGLITEYNPFHNGHLYHIQQAKRTTGADAVIVVMTAIMSKEVFRLSCQSV